MSARLAGLARAGGVLVVGAGLVLGVTQLPTSALDLSSGPPVAPASTRPVTSAQLVCPGSETLDGQSPDEQASAPAVVAAATPSAELTQVVGAAGEVSAETLPVKGGPAPLFRSPAASGSVQSAASVVVSASGSAAAGLVADQLTAVPSGDLRGLAGAPCAAPTTDAWLVGGGGDEGRRGRIVLTNAGPNPVEVSLHVLSADGPVDSTAGAAVAVPAFGRRTVLLGALAPSVTSPVVHVTTDGGAVGVTLHDARLHGTTARGADDVVPGTPPSRSVLVPGLAVDGAALLRVAVPGPDEAVAQVRLLGPDGEVVAPQNGVLRVPGGSARDLVLGDLPPGTYGVEVAADVPVVAGAMVERRTSPEGVADIAWLSSVPVTDHEHVLGAATAGGSPVDGLTSTLALTAPHGPATVQLVTGTAPPTSVQVAAGTTSVVSVPADQALTLRPADGSGPVVAARVLTLDTPDGALVTASSLWPQPLVSHLTPLTPAP